MDSGFKVPQWKGDKFSVWLWQTQDFVSNGAWSSSLGDIPGAVAIHHPHVSPLPWGWPPFFSPPLQAVTFPLLFAVEYPPWCSYVVSAKHPRRHRGITPQCPLGALDLSIDLSFRGARA